jgi:hypothetical protein
MANRFAAYFTLKGAWRSCDVKELGTYGTEQAAMYAGQQHASEQTASDPLGPRSLAWKRVPQGLTAPATWGRYDIRRLQPSKRLSLV